MSKSKNIDKGEFIQMIRELERDFAVPENSPGIIKVYKQTIPATRFIGKCFGSGQHPNWGFSWGNDVFGKAEGAVGNQAKISAQFEDADVYCGLYYRNTATGAYDGWCGMFLPPDTKVPEGLDFIDFSEQKLGVCWIYGKQSELYNLVRNCPEILLSAGMEIKSDANGYIGHFERDQCPRFTTPDDNGNIIVDYCYFVN